ncbi:MAG: hypothetical protein ABIQ89_00525 [Candidatus Saccharimonadales bacterium]
MAIEQFHSPGVIDHGPQPDFWDSLSELAVGLAGLRNGVESRMVMTITDVASYCPDFDPPEIGKPMQEIVGLVLCSKPDSTLIIVDTAVAIADEPRPWHTDTNTKGKINWRGKYTSPILTMPRNPYMMVLGGKTTSCIEGIINVDTADIIDASTVTVPGAGKLDDIDTAINDALDKIRDRPGVPIGAEGQILRVTDPQGDYRIVNPPEGHLFEPNTHTVHKGEDFPPIGRTLLYAM